MNRSTALSHELPLFPDTPDIWEGLDDVTRQQVLEHLARLLLGHGDTTHRPSIPSIHSDPKGSTR
jgi:hypothetical protein